MRVRRSILLLETGEQQSPALCGLCRPRLLLPAGFVDHFSESELRHVFLHELAHLKRHDIATHWLTTLLQIAHWFNPFVWLAFSRMRADRELACDALAMAATGAGERKAYGLTIVKLLERFSQSAPAPGLAGILENKSQLKQRIQMIGQYGRYYQGRAVALFLLIGLAAVGLTNAITIAPKEAESGGTPPLAIDSIVPRPVVTNGPTLKITVVDAITSKPIPGAMVYAPCGILFPAKDAGEIPRWTTDSSGVALIHLGDVPQDPELRMKSFSLLVHCPPYAPIGMSWGPSKPDITADARLQMPKEATAHLERGIKIGGTVKDEHGAPMPQATLTDFRPDMDPSASKECDWVEYLFCGSSSNSPVAITDKAGRWEMIGSSRCLENIIIECKRPKVENQYFSSQPGHLFHGLLPILGSFPEAARNLDAYTLFNDETKPIRYVDLLESRAELTLKSEFAVQGTVVDPEGKPLPGVRVKGGYAALGTFPIGEFQTDDKGMFECHFPDKPPILFTAYPTNYAISSIRMGTENKLASLRLQVQPLSPLRLHVADESGNPIGGTGISVSANSTEDQLLEFHGFPAADGTLTWTNAPRTALSMQINATNLQLNRLLRIEPGEREVTCQLRRDEAQEIQIRAQVRDQDTGQPVELASLDMRPLDSRNASVHERIDRAEFAFTIPAKKFKPDTSRWYALTLYAVGYENKIANPRSFDEGGWDAVFLMKKGGKRTGRIVTETGKPVDGAWIYYSTPERRELPAMLEPGRLDEILDTFRKATDGEGQFEITFAGKDTPVLILHEQGMAITSLHRLTNNPKLMLQPWGRVEGVVRVGNEPQKNVKVTLENKKPSGNSWPFAYDAKTDSAGRFVFDKVPHGECFLYQKWNRVISVKVKAGETTTANCGGEGRAIIAHLNNDVDWARFDQELTGKLLSPEKDPRPTYSQHMFYELRFDKDGGIRIDDVPVGTYELFLQGIKPPGNRFHIPRIPGDISTISDGKELAWLVREVVVPEMPGGRSDTPLDLGTLTLNWKDPSRPGIPVGAK
jgi:hypothetical protein